MNEKNRKNSERKRKCDDLLEINKGKIIKSEIEDTSGTESYESVPLFASSIKEELDVEIKSEPEDNVEDLNDIPNDYPKAIKDECNIKFELFEESETCIQLFNNTTKQPQAGNSKTKKQMIESQAIRDGLPWKIKQNIYENSNTALDIETQNRSYTSNKVNINTTADMNNENNDEIQQNEELPIFNIPSVKPLKKKDTLKDTNIQNSLITKDEFDLFGEYIAKTLRSLPGEMGIIAKKHVVNSLSAFQIKALGQNRTAPLLYGVTSCQNPDCSSSTS